MKCGDLKFDKAVAFVSQIYLSYAAPVKIWPHFAKQQATEKSQFAQNQQTP